MFVAYFYYGEVTFIEKSEKELGPGEKLLYSDTKLEALAVLARDNWKEYDELKKVFEENAAEILSNKDKIYQKIVEVSKEK